MSTSPCGSTDANPATSRARRRVVLFALAGFGYGTLLLLVGACADYCADGLHWSWDAPLLVGLCSAPLVLLPGEIILVGALCFWSFIGLLLGMAERPAVRSVVRVVLIAHYTCFVFLLATGFNEFSYWGVRDLRGDIEVVMLTVYLVGQIVIWWVLVRQIPQCKRRGWKRGDGQILGRTTRRPITFGAVGFAYGILLVLANALAVRHGGWELHHQQGISAIIGLYSSPLGLLPGRITFFGTPILWGVVGLLLAMAKRRTARVGLWMVMAAHYAGAMFLLPNRTFGDWQYFEKDWHYVEWVWRDSPGTIIAGLAAYVVGQIALWSALARQNMQLKPGESGRRRWQFSLKTLLLLPIVLGLLVGWLATERHRAEQHKMSVAQIQRFAGRVNRFDVPIPTKFFSDYFREQIEEDFQSFDVGAMSLRGLNEFNQVDLAGTQITDADLACLKGVPNLYTLNLNNTPITDAGLMHLQELAAMRYLQITDTQVTNEGVERLKRVLPEITIRH